jgi:hypothetical protein
MRTTVALDPDVAAEVERLRRERSAGVSAVVNELIRRGMTAPVAQGAFTQTVSPMGARLDVTNIAEVIETIDGPSAS